MDAGSGNVFPLTFTGHEDEVLASVGDGDG